MSTFFFVVDDAGMSHCGLTAGVVHSAHMSPLQQVHLARALLSFPIQFDARPLSAICPPRQDVSADLALFPHHLNTGLQAHFTLISPSFTRSACLSYHSPTGWSRVRNRAIFAGVQMDQLNRREFVVAAVACAACLCGLGRRRGTYWPMTPPPLQALWMWVRNRITPPTGSPRPGCPPPPRLRSSATRAGFTPAPRSALTAASRSTKSPDKDSFICPKPSCDLRHRRKCDARPGQKAAETLCHLGQCQRPHHRGQIHIVSNRGSMGRSEELHQG